MDGQIEHRGFLRNYFVYYYSDGYMSFIHLSKPVKWTTPDQTLVSVHNDFE